ncbi:MAG: Hpt domain-containing protein, partial [Gemmatimonadales bacterium]
MTDPVDAALLELQREYLRSMPKKLDELRSGIAALASGTPESEQSLRDGLHRLAGSGGSFGFSELSGIAREGERWLAANPGST